MTLLRRVELVLPFPPTANNYWRVVNGHPTRSAEANDYRAAVERLAPLVLARGVLMSRHVRIRAVCYRPRRIGDTDNLPKVLADALKGHVYADDNVTDAWVILRLDSDAEHPRAELAIEEHSEPPPAPAVLQVSTRYAAALAAEVEWLAAQRKQRTTKRKAKKAAKDAAAHLVAQITGQQRPPRLTKKQLKDLATPAYRGPSRRK